MTGQVFRRPGAKFVWAPPDGEPIVSLQPLNGRMYVATPTAIYTLNLPGIRAWLGRLWGS